ncbi:MAG: flagellar basal-body rod protein FlgF [Pseudomonadota bacterium]|nr:flagellar basal-body rod protein FlgF [Pseudomonadota bacterium]
MSSKGIYAALSGAIAQNQRLDTIANNIANANTAGFKKDNIQFKEYLTALEKQPDVMQIPRVPASIESFYDMQGVDRGYVDANSVSSDFSQGSLMSTGNKLDVAIEGDGFFEVLTPGGPRFTRSGNFKIDNQGNLISSSGFPVLKAGAGDPAQRIINLKGSNVTVAYNGEVFDGSDSLGKLSVINVDQKDALAKEGMTLYNLRPNYNVNMTPANETKIHQGFLEASNVNIVQEMTDMIGATRVFESNQRAIKAYDQIDEKLTNDVPRVSRG